MGDIKNFINGEYITNTSGKTFEKRTPIDNTLVGMVHEAGKPEVDAAVAAADAALRGPWGKLSISDRVALLDAVADEINRRFDDFLAAEVADTGKPHGLAAHVDIPRGAANFKIFADTIKNASTESFTMSTPDGGTALSYAVRAPRGVIAVVCPWNLPLLLMTWKVGPALACGNTVVVKPSEETPSTATLLGEVMNKVGVPKGVYNVVHGFGPDSAGAFLTTHPGVNGITFTGETRTGTAIMKAGADGIRPVSLELGGKNAAIVFADCDFDVAINTVTRSAFENCGQVCLGTERVYVERPIFDKFVAALKEKAEAMKPGRPEDPDTKIGPLVSHEHLGKVLSYYNKAKEEGATIVTGGGVPEMPYDLRAGAWVQPTIWTGLPETASVVREEIFGPCCHIQPFDTEGEAVRMANDTPYGLATSIYTRDIGRAHRLAAEIVVGLCWINSWFLRDLRTAFGGSKQSGIGREGGVHSLEFYTELRNVMIKVLRQIMENAQIERYGDELYRALIDRRAVDPLTDRDPAITIEDAYRIQLRMIQRRVDAGETIVGKKIGVTSKIVMQMLKVDQPDFGQMTSGMVFNEGEALQAESMIAPRAEAEVAFVLKGDLQGPGITAADVLRATDFVLPCFEIVDSRIKDWKIKIQDTVADNASCGVLTLGGVRKSPRQLDLALAGMVLEKNGEVISTSTGAAVQGSPANAVAWLANTLGRLGIGLKAGEIILSGSQSPLVPIKAGDSLTCTVGGLGGTSIRFI